MMTTRLVRTLVIFLLLICNFGCDQISKIVIRRTIGDDQQFSFLNNHLTVTKIENKGAFLSLGDSMSHPFRVIFLSFFPMIILGYGLFFLLTQRNMSKRMLVGTCFVIGGGIGNIFDRIVHGSVTDFLHIDFGFFQTGVFNLADVSIMTGMLLIVIEYIFKRVELNDSANQLP